MAEQRVPAPTPSPGEARPYPWMWPARHLEWLRPGLRATTDADARRLRALPAIAGGVLLPVAAVLIPALVAVAQATTVPFFQGNPYEPWSLLIYDVFTESVPFMLAGLAIGLLSPAAGVLFVVAYGVGNVAATIVTGELEPPLPALFGRFASLVLFWLLVVDIPIVGRLMVEWGIGGPATSARRSFAVLGGTFVAAALVLAWSLTAGLLIGVVFWLTAPFGIGPTLRASNTLETTPWLLVLPAGVLVLLLLALRYGGREAPLAGDEPRDPPPSRARRLARSVVSLAFVLTLLSGTLSQVIDVAILGAGLIAGRPIARKILRSTGLATQLVRLSWPVRLVAAGLVSFAFSVAFISLVGNSSISRWFNAVIAIVIAFILVEVFLEADGVAAASARRQARGRAEASAVTTGALVLVPLLLVGTLTFPAPMRADAYGDAADTFWLLTSLAAGSSALLAALAMSFLGPNPQHEQWRREDEAWEQKQEEWRRGPDPGRPPERPYPPPPPPDVPRDPISGEPWDGSGPYPRNPTTGEPIVPGSSQ